MPSTDTRELEREIAAVLAPNWMDYVDAQKCAGQLVTLLRSPAAISTDTRELAERILAAMRVERARQLGFGCEPGDEDFAHAIVAALLRSPAERGEGVPTGWALQTLGADGEWRFDGDFRLSMGLYVHQGDGWRWVPLYAASPPAPVEGEPEEPTAHHHP